jgi:hypothetical protein
VLQFRHCTGEQDITSCFVVYSYCYEDCDVTVNVTRYIFSRQLPIALGTHLQVTKSFGWSGTGDSSIVKNAGAKKKYRYVLCKEG